MQLAFQRVAGGERVLRRALFLHGILGTGANLRSIARRFVAARPEWDACTIDLRGHGASAKSQPNPSLAAAAGDVVELAASSDVPVAMLIGHSFGGGVALEAARQGLPLAHLMTIDSPPGSRTPLRDGDSALAVIAMLRSLPPTFPSRDAFTQAVMARDHSQMLAGWLAMSTETRDGAVRFALDLDEIEALVLDFFAADRWPFVEDAPEGLQIHFVIGERSSAWSAADRERARALAARDARVTVDVLATDHWVHAEDPDGLLAVLLDRV